MIKNITITILTILFICSCSNNTEKICKEKHCKNGVDCSFSPIYSECIEKGGKTYNEVKNQLIQGGCKTIKVDINGNTCSINSGKTDYNEGCTEKLTTKMLDFPICVD